MRYVLFLCFVLALAACHSNSGTPAAGQPTSMPGSLPAAEQVQMVMNDSQHIEYYPNRKEKMNAQLKAGKMQGAYRSFYENGTAREKGMMADDQKTGLWYFYDSSGRLNQVGIYANDKMVRNLDTADYHLVSKKLAPEKMQLTVPYDWQVVDVGVNPMVVMVCEKKCNEADQFCPNFTFTKEPLDGRGTFDDYIAYGDTMLKATIPNFKLVSKGKTTINGYKAYRVEYRGKAENLQLGSVMTLFYAKDTVYIMNCMAKDQPKGNFDNYQNLFMEISNSVKPL